MKTFVYFFVLVLSSLTALGQFQTQDTLNKTGIPGRYRLAFPGGGDAYQVGPSGPSSLLIQTKPMSISAVRAMTATSKAQAPQAILITDKLQAGTFLLDMADIVSADNTGTVLVTASGLRYKRQSEAGSFNVLHFGADNTATLNSSPAINAAISAAAAFVAVNGGAYRAYVLFPPGWYLAYQTLNCANQNGIVLKAQGGSYINTGIIGVTSTTAGTGAGIVVDMTGSTLGQIEGLSITASSAWGAIASKIGVQFALSQNGSGQQLGGLNGQIKNCYIDMGDQAGINGGMGSIGLLDIRSEEFTGQNCLIRANAPAVFTNRSDLGSSTPYSITFSSPNATVATTAGGSMGVVDLSGQVSLQAYNKYAPALTLVNTNSVRMHGYMSRLSATAGSMETAIGCYGQNDNLSISATIESYASVLSVGAQLTNLTLNVVQANLTNHTSPGIDVTGGHLYDSNLTFTYNDPLDYTSGRVLLYHADVGGGDSPATGNILNTVITCAKWPDNSTFISANLLKTASNVDLNAGQPIMKRNNSVIDKKTFPIFFGTISAGNPDLGANLTRFAKADKATTSSGNGGYYRAKVSGTIIAGTYSTTALCALDFEATALLTQNSNGSQNAGTYKVLLLNKSSGNAAYLDITDLALVIDMSGTYGLVRLYVKNAGSGVGQPVNFIGSVQLESDFAVKQSVIFN